MKEIVDKIPFVSKWRKTRHFCNKVSTCGFSVGAGCYTVLSFLDENIQKSKRIVRFHFFGNFYLVVNVVEIKKKSLSKIHLKRWQSNHQHTDRKKLGWWDGVVIFIDIM